MDKDKNGDNVEVCTPPPVEIPRIPPVGDAYVTGLVDVLSGGSAAGRWDHQAASLDERTRWIIAEAIRRGKPVAVTVQTEKYGRVEVTTRLVKE
jgi:hypothetical protein